MTMFFLPRFQGAAIAVWRRNMLVWRKLMLPSIFINFGDYPYIFFRHFCIHFFINLHFLFFLHYSLDKRSRQIFCRKLLAYYLFIFLTGLFVFLHLPFIKTFLDRLA